MQTPLEVWKLERIFEFVFGFESTFSTAFNKEEVKIKSHVTMVNRYTGYVIKSVSVIQAQISL